MKTSKCFACAERRQLELIQRIGRIGYWEYEPDEKSVSLSEESLSLLASALRVAPGDCPPFMAALGDIERKRFQAALDQAVAGQLVLNIELKLVSGDRSAYVIVRGAPAEIDQDKFGFAGTLHDITAEKNREADHREVSTQLQALLDALPQGVSVIDKDLRLIHWNRGFHEVLDLPQDMIFKHALFEDLIRFNARRGDYGPGDPETHVGNIVSRARQFLPHRFERQATGGRTILVEGFPFKVGGEVSGFIATYTDITEQQRTEEQLTRQRDVMKTIIDNFPGGISLCDTDLRFTAYNDQFLELLEFPRSLFAKGWVDFVDLARFNADRGEYGPGDRDEQVKAIVDRAHNFQAHKIERKRPNGRWLDIRGTPIPSGGFVTSYIDITERKLIEAELVHAKETAEARREQVVSLLDNSGQGFLSFGADLVVDAECSRACETMLGLNPAGHDAAEVLFAGDAAKADLLRSTVTAALAESEPWMRETMLSLLPAEFRHGDGLLEAEYKLLENGRVMIVLTDITEKRRLERNIETERRRLAMIVAAITDSRDFFDTVEAFREFATDGVAALLAAAAEPAAIAKELYRQVHTFKGLLNQFSFLRTPAALHGLEGRLEDLRQADKAISRQALADILASTPLQALLDDDLTVLRDALGPEFLEYGARVVLTAAQAEQLQQLAARLLRGEPVDMAISGMRRLLRDIGQLHKVSLREALGGFDRLVRQTAARCEKELAELRVVGGEDIWIDPRTYQPFLRALTHIFRNAVVHGIETPDTRIEMGKDEAGTITCSIRGDGSHIRLDIADDGGGIDVEALRRHAIDVGLISVGDSETLPPDQILNLIFVDNVSTQQETTELAGRGVGLAVVRSETRKLNGEVTVNTIAGQGTHFLFTLPRQNDALDVSEA